MGQMTIHAILYSFFAAVLEITAAFIVQKIQRTVTENAVKPVFVWLGMAREILAIMITIKFKTFLHHYPYLP